MVDLSAIKVIVLAEKHVQEQFCHVLASLTVSTTFVEQASELLHVLQHDTSSALVLLVPYDFLSGDSWTLEGVLNHLWPRPAFLVYAPEASFAKWSSVLDSGGFDIITTPLSEEKLRAVLPLAADSRKDEHADF